ncbi:E3 ubiquitin-protein ligase RNF31 isoform X2 [Amia ocellicauda]|uniref:E3 ubiquitin-protein ligase RNF31 isoform X2 n=1 Tax=Amia ocellicauda TaxID=2972642 RepID=UPI0034642731
MKMPSDLDRLEELRARAETLLASGSAQEVRPAVEEMASLHLPLSDKYRHIAAEAMVRENGGGASDTESMSSLQKLSTALNILEKYGCNLVSPGRPRYWRTVKHNNPVFRATVDSITGGRAVLCLYGYSNQQSDGLSFPEDVKEPDTLKVAAVTLEVMTLRLELDILIKGVHPHPAVFQDVTMASVQQGETLPQAPVVASPDSVLAGGAAGNMVTETDSIPLQYPLTIGPAPIMSPTHVPAQSLRATPPSLPPNSHTGECSVCGNTPTLSCPPCGSTLFCETCDLVFHRHPGRANHNREPLRNVPDSCTICGIFPVSVHCPSCIQWLCSDCDRLYHSHPARGGHRRSSVASPSPRRLQSCSPAQSVCVRSLSGRWVCVSCSSVNEGVAALCLCCERPRAAPPPAAREDTLPPVTLSCQTSSEWCCQSCTVLNPSSSVLCEVCERPRLATRPPALSGPPPQPLSSPPPAAMTMPAQWVCQFCTFVNASSGPVCEMCNLARPDHAPAPSQYPVTPATKEPPAPITPSKPAAPPIPTPRKNADWLRQSRMKEDGLKLIRMIREGESRGFSPEEVWAAANCSESSEPCDWLRVELPHMLEELCEAARFDLQGAALSQQEAKEAWIRAGGQRDRALILALRDRQAKVRELQAVGMWGGQCAEALRRSGGSVREALCELQRPLLEPFHQRLWSQDCEPAIDVKHTDKQRVLRRLLAVFELPSWGRCELALSLLQEPGAPYGLEDVVQAVRESHDRDLIHRLLAKECPICITPYPQSKMRALTSCQCSVCSSCFQQYFTITVRDRHIREMVCPVCGLPDINEQAQLNSYFSTLDIQLRDCLEPEVYQLFHQKLTEQALIQDPKFLWCTHCSFGFIYDGDQLKVTCLQCRKSFCAKCRKPWEQQHAGLTCEQFQLWKRENDPEYQRQGLAGYLRDNGITCPSCGFQYALSKGGCMHFTCSQCRHQFCSGCNNPFHTSQSQCSVQQCSVTGLHAHHPRDCFFYLRDWDPTRLQILLQNNNVEFNTEPPPGSQAGQCGVMEQKEEGARLLDAPCGAQSQRGQAGLCEKHYREYLVSLINGHALDPAPLYDTQELLVACGRYHLDHARGEAEDDAAYHSRLLRKLMTEVPLGDTVPRKK